MLSGCPRELKEDTMAYDHCLDCGALLPPHENKCPRCGCDNILSESQDFEVEDGFFNDLGEDMSSDVDSDYE